MDRLAPFAVRYSRHAGFRDRFMLEQDLLDFARIDVRPARSGASLRNVPGVVLPGASHTRSVRAVDTRGIVNEITKRSKLAMMLITLPRATYSLCIFSNAAGALFVFRDAAIEMCSSSGRVPNTTGEDCQRERNEEAQRAAIIAESIGVSLFKLSAQDLSYRMLSKIPDTIES